MIENQLLSERIKKAHIVLNRLERISADSKWAHKASGLRASLAKALHAGQADSSQLDKWIKAGFEILQKAASEIPE